MIAKGTDDNVMSLKHIIRRQGTENGHLNMQELGSGMHPLHVRKEVDTGKLNKNVQ